MRSIVFKNLANGVRISSLSSNQESFDAVVSYYNEALAASGFKYRISNMPKPNTCRRKRYKNIIWFSSTPFSLNTTMPVGRLFLRLTNKHFTNSHKYVSILTGTTLGYRLIVPLALRVSQRPQATGRDGLYMQDPQHLPSGDVYQDEVRANPANSTGRNHYSQSSRSHEGSQ